ncbi:C-type mannose receptor 2-like [Branchiostoma floridae x Branchiostoma japonicum]
MPQDREINDFLKSFYQSVRKDNSFWIGLHDQHKEGQFEWIDGDSIGEYNSWNPGEPNNALGGQDCTHYWPPHNGYGLWYDADCNQGAYFICQVVPGTFPEGYVLWRGIYYKAFNTRKSFSGAAATCRQDGGTLTMPRDKGINKLLTALFKPMDTSGAFWIGLHDQRKEGQFEWIDGDSIGEYNSWNPGEPNNANSGEHCVQTVYPDPFGWNDASCQQSLPFICQIVTGAFNEKGYEKLHGMYYKAFDEPKSFSGAAAICRLDGATLAMPRDKETNDILNTFFQSVSESGAFWIGLHDQQEEGQFEWLDGYSLAEYNAWHPGEPNNSLGEEDCAQTMLLYTVGTFGWNDISCHQALPFICQIHPDP